MPPSRSPRRAEVVTRSAAVTGSTPRRVLAISVALAWLASAATALAFALSGVALDAAAAGAGPDELPLAGLAAALAIAAAAVGAGEWFSQRSMAVAECRLRRALVSRIFRTGSTSAARQAGELLSLGTHATERAAGYRAGFLGPIVGALTTPFVVLVVMGLTTDWRVALTLAALVLVVPLAVGAFQRIVQPVGAEYRRAQASLTAAFLEAIQSLGTLVYARAAKRTGADLARRGEHYRRSLMRLLAGNQVLIFVIDAAFSLAIVVAAALLALERVSAGELSLGSAVTIILMSVLVIGPVDVVGQFFYIGIGGRAAERSLAAALPDIAGGGSAAPPAPTAPGGATPRESVRSAAIRLEHVDAGWQDGTDVLRSLSLAVHPGEHVALVGPSGVGKSTVSALLQGQLLPRSGRVVVDGLDTRSADPRELRRRIAAVEQRPYLFMGSIADNLRLAAPHASEAALWRALDLAGLAAEVREMPGGLGTPVGEHGTLLSGGQAQRLAIARAALRDAPILILDEPTSQLGLAAEREILAALGRLAAGRTVLMIAHRPGAILTATRSIELSTDRHAA